MTQDELKARVRGVCEAINGSRVKHNAFCDCAIVLAALDAVAAEALEAAERERDEILCAAAHNELEITSVDGRDIEIESLRARLARVEGAAQPIAARAADYEGSNDHAWVGKTANGQPLRVGHLRALRLALRDEPPAEQEKKGGQDE